MKYSITLGIFTKRRYLQSRNQSTVRKNREWRLVFTAKLLCDRSLRESLRFSTSIEIRVPSKFHFYRNSTSIEIPLLSKLDFYWNSTCIDFRLLSKLDFHRNSTSIDFRLPSKFDFPCSPITCPNSTFNDSSTARVTLSTVVSWKLQEFSGQSNSVPL